MFAVGLGSTASVEYELYRLCPSWRWLPSVKRMSATEVILILVGTIGLVFGIVAAGRALERRAARKLVSPLLGRPCPSCGGSFHLDAIRSARLEHGFDGPSYPTLVCPDCSKRWALLEGELTEVPL